MSWYVGLPEDEQASWKRLRRAILDRFRGGEHKPALLSAGYAGHPISVSAPPTASRSTFIRSPSPSMPTSATRDNGEGRIVRESHATLFSSDAEEGMWMNHGSGVVSLVAGAKGQAVRLLVKSNNPLKVLVDRPVTSRMCLTPESSTSWVWQAKPDTSFAGQKSSITIRFLSAQTGQEFKKAFDTAAE